MSVDVLNGTSIAGRAGRNGDALRVAGFHVDAVDSTDSDGGHHDRVPQWPQSGAKAVAAAVPGAALTETGSVHKVTLVLGFNGVQAKALGHSNTDAAPHSSGAKAPKAPPGRPNCIN